MFPLLLALLGIGVVLAASKKKPAALPAPAPPPPELDVGMRPELMRAVTFALSKETDPKKLSDFSKAVAVEFPISQSLLLAKSRMLTSSRTPPAPRTPEEAAVQKVLSNLHEAPVEDIQKALAWLGTQRKTSSVNDQIESARQALKMRAVIPNLESLSVSDLGMLLGWLKAAPRRTSATNDLTARAAQALEMKSLYARMPEIPLTDMARIADWLTRVPKKTSAILDMAQNLKKWLLLRSNPPSPDWDQNPDAERGPMNPPPGWSVPAPRWSEYVKMVGGLPIALDDILRAKQTVHLQRDAQGKLAQYLAPLSIKEDLFSIPAYMPPIEDVRRIAGAPQASYTPDSTPNRFCLALTPGAELTCVTSNVGLKPGFTMNALGIVQRDQKQPPGTLTLPDRSVLLTGVRQSDVENILVQDPEKDPSPAYLAYVKGEWLKNKSGKGIKSEAELAQSQLPYWKGVKQKLEDAKAQGEKSYQIARDREYQDYVNSHRNFFQSLGHSIAKTTEGLEKGVSDAFKAMDDIPGVNLVSGAGEIGLGFLDDVASGRNPVKGVVHKVGEEVHRIAKTVQTLAPVLSYVPGIGTGVAVALTTAAGVALGQPLSDAALNGVAAGLPGAPASQMAFKAAVSAGKAIADGKRIDQIALETTRAALPSDAAKVAFDAGVSLAKGKSLQDAGFAALRNFVPGGTLGEQAEHFAEAVVKAKEAGKNVKDFLIDQTKDEIGKLGGDVVNSQLRPLLAQVNADPSLLKMTPKDLAKQVGVPEPIARAALSSAAPYVDANKSVKDVAVAAVHPDVVKKLLAGSPPSLPSPDAAKTVALAKKGNPEEVKKVQAVQSLAKTNPVAGKALQNLQSSSRILERQRWIDHYRAEEERLTRRAA